MSADEVMAERARTRAEAVLVCRHADEFRLILDRCRASLSGNPPDSDGLDDSEIAAALGRLELAAQKLAAVFGEDVGRYRTVIAVASDFEDPERSLRPFVDVWAGDSELL